MIKVLTEMLGIKISFARLDEKAEEVKRITSRIRRLEKALMEKESKEDLRYIG